MPAEAPVPFRRLVEGYRAYWLSGFANQVSRDSTDWSTCPKQAGYRSKLRFTKAATRYSFISEERCDPLDVE
jgi:hypothetical protein